MNRVLVLGLSLAVACLADDWSKKFVVSGHPDLRVNANDGSVTVRT